MNHNTPIMAMSKEVIEDLPAARIPREEMAGYRIMQTSLFQGGSGKFAQILTENEWMNLAEVDRIHQERFGEKLNVMGLGNRGKGKKTITYGFVFQHIVTGIIFRAVSCRPTIDELFCLRRPKSD